MTKLDSERVEDFKESHPLGASWVTGMPTVTLSNGAVVGNFSSGHSFHFEDGSVLEGCDPERVDGLRMSAKDIEVQSRLHPALIDVRKVFDLEIDSNGVVQDEDFRDALAAAEGGDAHVVIVPFPLLQQLAKTGFASGCKFRTIFSVERAKDGKPPVISASRFCTLEELDDEGNPL